MCVRACVRVGVVLNLIGTCAEDRVPVLEVSPVQRLTRCALWTASTGRGVGGEYLNVCRLLLWLSLFIFIFAHLLLLRRSRPGRGRAAPLWVPTGGFSPQDVSSRGFRSCGMRLMRTNLFDDVSSSGASPARRAPHACSPLWNMRECHRLIAPPAQEPEGLDDENLWG